ncbi:glycosyltransferase [Thermostilla marina]
MIVLHASPVAWKHIGGITNSTSRLVRAEAQLGATVGLLVTYGDRRQPGAETAADRVGARVPVFYREDAPGGNIDGLPAPYCRPDIVVFHSTFIPYHARFADVLRQKGIPYILCPRGGLTRYALHRRWWKKRLGRLLFFDRLVRGSIGIRFLTEREREDSLDYGKPYFVCGNDISLPESSKMAKIDGHRRRRLMFLGRLAIRHKGLDRLIEAADAVQQELRISNCCIELTGPTDGNSEYRLRKEIARRNLADLVLVRPPVTEPETKSQRFRSAAAFLHPSRFEGHPQAVLEAMAHGLPCLVTPGTNVADVVARYDAGWAVGGTVEEIARGLVEIAKTPVEELRRRGRNARAYVERECTWERVASKTLEGYRYLLDRAGLGARFSDRAHEGGDAIGSPLRRSA